MPEALGGYRCVPCCLHCNQLKADLHPEDWFFFIRRVPDYWRLYDTHEQLHRALLHMRIDLAWRKSVVEIEVRLPDAPAKRQLAR